jgi:hypothetical protein
LFNKVFTGKIIMKIYSFFLCFISEYRGVSKNIENWMKKRVESWSLRQFLCLLVN